MPTLWAFSAIYHKKETELLKKKIDSRSGLGNVQDISNSIIIKGFFS